MKCLEILEFLRQKCNQCFQDKQAQQDRRTDSLQQPFVEMRQLNDLKIPVKQKETKTPPEHQEKSVVIVQITSDPEEEVNQKELSKKDHAIQPQMIKQKASFSEQEFQSIESFHSIERVNVMGSSKRLASQLQKIKNRRSSKDISFRNSESYYSSEVEDTPTSEKININTEIGKIKEWMKQEYGKPRYASFRISHAVKLQMNGQAMSNHIIHKFEDFRTNFLYESSQNSGYYFINNSKTLEAEYYSDKPLSHLGKQKITTYIKIKCFTSKITHILQLVLSKNMMKIHGFGLSKTVDYEGGYLGLNLPILEVSQNNKESRETVIYHLANQISQVCSEEQGRRVVLVSYSLDDGENSWQRVVKILVGVIGELQVYCESFEEINNRMEERFKNNFSDLEKWCSEMGLITLN